MKKLFLVLLAVGLFASCQKKPTTPPAKTQAVSFGVNVMSPNNFKQDPLYDTILCSDVIPDMAWIQIDGNDYYAQLTKVDGKLYTQSIQLSPGAHSVQEFILYKETDGTPGPTTTDPIVYGTPRTGSAFAIYVTNPVEFSINVDAFAKTEVPVEVLCFTPAVYDSFGYDWFIVDRIVVRHQCFYGDFCTKHFADYAESDYNNQSTGLQIDMPAIFQIKGFQKRGDGDWTALPGGVFTNDNAEAGWGVGAPVCVEYGDKLGVVDSLKFELYILVKQGTDFNFVLFHTFMFNDDEMIPAGADGVVDFELGNCNVGGADLQLPPYINLPAQVTLKVGNNVPGALLQPDGTLGYFDVTLSGIPGTPGDFDITNGGYPVNCMQRGVNIYMGQTYTMLVESSLYPDAMKSAFAKAVPWDKVNWLINHLTSYPGRTWSDVQQALWMLEDSGYNGLETGSYLPDPISSVGLQMVADANLLGGGFVPGPGDLAAIAFEVASGNPVQIVIIKLDP